MSSLRDVPTLSESELAGCEYTAVYGAATPADTPPEIIARLDESIAKIVNTPDMKDLLNKGELEPETNNPCEFSAFVKSQPKRSRRLIKLAGIAVE